MPEEAPPSKGLSREAWGAITAITVAVISGIVTLAVHLWQPSTSPTATSPTTGSPTAGAGAPQAPNADAVAGRWEGTASAADGKPFHVEVDIATECTVGARCGIIAVSSLPCFGTIHLYTIDHDDYEFRVDEFTKTSATACTPGPGEHLRPLPDGTLQYTTNYGPRGVLRKQ